MTTSAPNMSHKPIDLSIIVVSYNTQAMTCECLNSVFKHSNGLSLQVIVVDNNSVDGSAESIREKFPQVELVVNHVNKGFAAANNQAFPLCRGSFLLLLNSDTIILDDVLSASLAYLQKHPQVGAMGCQVLNSDYSIQATCSGFPTIPRLALMTLALDRIKLFTQLDSYLMRSWDRKSEKAVEVISGCYLMIKKEVLEQVGNLDDNFFFFGEETDWCRRIKQKGWQLYFAPVGRIVHHGGGSVKKLNYKRDVMLTAATVRLHRKHGGIIAAVSTYMLLLLFNLSRAGIWTFISLYRKEAKSRAQHFTQVTMAWRECWPK